MSCIRHRYHCYTLTYFKEKRTPLTHPPIYLLTCLPAHPPTYIQPIHNFTHLPRQRQIRRPARPPGTHTYQHLPTPTHLHLLTHSSTHSDPLPSPLTHPPTHTCSHWTPPGPLFPPIHSHAYYTHTHNSIPTHTPTLVCTYTCTCTSTYTHIRANLHLPVLIYTRQFGWDCSGMGRGDWCLHSRAYEKIYTNTAHAKA